MESAMRNKVLMAVATAFALWPVLAVVLARS